MVGRFGLPSCILMIPIKSKSVLAFVIILLCHIPQTLASEDNDGKLLDTSLFAAKLVDDFGTDGQISVKQLENLLNSIQRQTSEDHDSAQPKDHDHVKASEYTVSNGAEKHSASDDSDCSNSPIQEPCLDKVCLTADNIFMAHSLGTNTSANVAQFKEMSSTILYQLQNPTCYRDRETEHISKHGRPPAVQVWGYGFLCVTLINLCAITGMVFLPLMKKSFYTKLLMFMVALAVGTLAGSSLLFLIPECFGMTHDDSPLLDTYIWKSTTIIGGVYLFFLTERFLKMIMNFRRKKRNEKKPADIMSSIHSARHRNESMNMSFEPPSKDIQLAEGGNLLSCKSTNSEEDESIAAVKVANGGKSVIGNGHSHAIKSVAWMIIFGDGLHNFIDGLSIGAAFAGNIMTGISVSVAVICEELPHELGDFAILLNSGMTMKQALGYNFLSACMCYMGLIIGTLIGEMTSGAEWIFAIAGGMFLYISLVDMLPEVNHAAEVEEEETGRQFSVFLIQNIGLLVGYGIMLFLAYFGGQIDFGN